ncbi:MAG: SH3 domain-containing protein [Thermoanaerobacteraceae bacterium]|nr:SH3 domain-containing protein [Thermoanaerobacteraceae bacterium]
MYKLLKPAAAITTLLLGFILGTAVQAGSGGPGTSADPLASRSYVHRAVNEKIAELQQQVTALQQRVNRLSSTITALEKVAGVEGVAAQGVPAPGTYLLEREVAVYEQPDTGAPVVAKLKPSQQFAVIELQDGWYHVELSGGVRGWITGEYVRTK